jgi:hypothetical protein
LVTNNVGASHGSEAEAPVETDRAVVRRVHFERELAAAARVGAPLDLLEQPAPDAAAAVAGQHGEIVHVQRGAAGEGREAPDADGGPDRGLSVPREQRERGGVRAQPGASAARAVARERRALTARLARIAVDDLDERPSLREIEQIDSRSRAAAAAHAASSHTAARCGSRGDRDAPDREAGEAEGDSRGVAGHAVSQGTAKPPTAPRPRRGRPRCRSRTARLWPASAIMSG